MDLKLSLFTAGYCTSREHFIFPDRPWRRVSIPAHCALIEHPTRGLILIDTGYAPAFFQATQRLPYRIFRWLTPTVVTPADTIRAQLAGRGIGADQVKSVLITHFHPDHIAGLNDFPDAVYLFLPEAYAAVRTRRGLAALNAAFLPDLMPPDFERRARPIEPERACALPDAYAPFAQGYDILGDGSLLGVSLPGHAHGQLGLFLHDQFGRSVFLIADACWHSRAFRELIYPHPLTNRLQADAAAYRQTLHRLHHLHRRQPDLTIVPFHCPEVVTTTPYFR